MTKRKPPKAKAPEPVDVRLAALRECLSAIGKHRATLRIQADNRFFKRKIETRIEECDKIEEEILKLLPHGER